MDISLSIVAIMVSIGAFTLSFFSMKANEKNNIYNHEPELVDSLDIDVGTDITTFTKEISNNGKGVAYFHKIQLFVDKNPYSGTIKEFLENLLVGIDVISISSRKLANNYAVSPTQTIVMGKLVISTKDYEKVQSLIDGSIMDIRICYENKYSGEIKVWSTDEKLRDYDDHNHPAPTDCQSAKTSTHPPA